MAIETDSSMKPEGVPKAPDHYVFWRVEGSLLDWGSVRPVAFFARNSQTFAERWTRRIGGGIIILLCSLLSFVHRVWATRVLHTMLRGISQDRLDLLGEEYFDYTLKPQLKPRGVAKLQEQVAAGRPVVLVSEKLEHVVRPLANHLGVRSILANRLEFRDGLATGRLLAPIVPPRRLPTRLVNHRANGRISASRIRRELRVRDRLDGVSIALRPAGRAAPSTKRPLVLFEECRRVPRLSVRESLAGKQILLIGVTGFIGKVWLLHLLTDLPQIEKIYLLIRRQGPHSAWKRFEKIVAESPAFDGLHERYGDRLGDFLRQRIDVIEGDVVRPDLGIPPELRARLCHRLDLVVNSSGLTDFNPDLREALATNVDAVVHLLDFLRQSDHAAFLHLSTCYAAGDCDGRISEELVPNYTPAHVPGFSAEREWKALHDTVRRTESRSHSPALVEEWRRHALEKAGDRKRLSDSALEAQIRKQRSRWMRHILIRTGTRRAKELGWPNTYTLTKSLAESLIHQFGTGMAVASVRPSIVETSLQQPFRGWNEGVNTSAPLSYLLGTYFRQLPTNERKRLDVIPVDIVCRGMTLISAALVNRCHQPVYQLATSAVNPCDMRRSIELTGLAHRKHYRSQNGLEHWLRSRFDTIPVSKQRYQKFSAPRQRAIIQALQRTMQPLPFLQSPLARTERNLDRVEKIIELYEPFILHNDHVFEADNVQFLSLALPPEERETFGYDATSIDWWDYWINIHVPAQRRWSYPLIEGRPLEVRPARTIRLVPSSESAPLQETGENREDPSSARSATWQSS